MSVFDTAVEGFVSSDRISVSLSRFWEISVWVQPGAMEETDDQVRPPPGELLVPLRHHPGYGGGGRVWTRDDLALLGLPAIRV